MDTGLKILSDITVWSKYAKYIPLLERRETWDEIVDRYENMMVDKYPHLRHDIIENSIYIRDKKVLPSMRMLQFAGKAIQVNQARGYNCSYLPIDHYKAFSEIMFLLLGGTGVGYSVQKNHVSKLPEIKKSTSNRKFVVSDDIQGWADSIKILMKWAFGMASKPIFDYSDIRPKGARLITAGGKAPGAEPLKLCHAHIFAIIDRKEDEEKLTPLECHDILCHIANAVLAGGIRRAAMIAGFDLDDTEMLTCKFGNWWELNEQRGRSNNSVVLKRSKLQEEDFKNLWHKIEISGSGEPGFYLTNNTEWFTNPCAEIALRPFQMCNLCEINFSSVENQEDFEDRVRVATFFGTLQAGFTDFYYLRDVWKRTCEKDALLGIGITGLARDMIYKIDFTKAVDDIAIPVNKRISEIININSAARITCVKPSGSTSCVLGTSSGIHDWHSDYYLRTMRFNKNEAISSYLIINHPELVEDDQLRPHDTICVRIPIKAPEGSYLRNKVSAIELLERIKYISENWIYPGHISGDNTHNVSATISLNKNKMYTLYDPNSGYYELNEWELVGEWMWINKKSYNGLSVLPYNGGNYVQAPFETITKEEYEERVKHLHSVDLTKVIEFDDNVEFGQIAACSGSQCEINI